MKHVSIYTRGICNHQNIGGYGIILIYKGQQKELSGRCQEATNNRMDLLAVTEGLKGIKEPCRVTIYNNNTYVIDAMTKGWIHQWKGRNWRNAEKKPTPHVDLWEQLLELCQQHKVEFTWLKYSSKQKEYKRCDTLARIALLER